MVAILYRYIWASLAPWVHLSHSITAGHRCSAAQCWVTGRVAQFGRNPWVGSLCAPQGPKGVMVGMGDCAELLRSSRVVNARDRM